MLDFYLIQENQPKPSSPQKAGLEFAGGIDSVTFESLQAKGVIDQRFDFYSDIRFSTEIITQIRQTILRKKQHTESDVKKLLALFDVAESKMSGLLAYGD